jgi:pimeloyl-ACP methyl ester carboxylesterase
MWADQLAVIGSIYRVLAPDLRGHGESFAPEGVYTMDEMADDVVELLDELGITQPIILGGLSMGGYVALSLVLRYPEQVRALMLIDTKAAADTPEAAQTREETARHVLAADDVGPVVTSMVPRLFSKTTLEQHPELVEPISAMMAQTTPRGAAGALRGMAVRPDRRGDLPRITIPTLVLVGQEDVISPPEEARAMADALPRGQYEVIPTAGHLSPYENPSAVNTAMLRFFQSLGDSVPSTMTSR